MINKLLNRWLNDFIELRNILISEDGENWLPGINLIINDLLNAIENNNEAIDFVKSARDTYSSINKGNGSFSDFCVWRENFDERKKANQNFDNLKKRIYLDFNVIFNQYS